MIKKYFYLLRKLLNYNFHILIFIFLSFNFSILKFNLLIFHFNFYRILITRLFKCHFYDVIMKFMNQLILNDIIEILTYL